VLDCDKTSKEKAERLLKEFREKRKAKGKMGKMSGAEIEKHSTLFSVKFADTVEALAIADPGSCANLLPSHLFRKLRFSVGLKAN